MSEAHIPTTTGLSRLFTLSAAGMKSLNSSLVGEAGHYLNRPGELRGGVLKLIRAHRDRLEQCVRTERFAP
jgi:hypothetical protein